MSDQVTDNSPSVEGTELPGDDSPKTTFADLGLGPEVLKAVTDMGFTEPMDVQRATIPLAREGRDILVQSEPGRERRPPSPFPLPTGLPTPRKAILRLWCCCPRVSWPCRSPPRQRAFAPIRRWQWFPSTAARPWAGKSNNSRPVPKSSAEPQDAS